MASLTSQLRLNPNRSISELQDFGGEQVAGADTVFGGSLTDIIGTANQDGAAEANAEARTRANTNSDNLRGQLERRQRALGLNLTDRQQRSQTRRLGLSRAINEASAGTSANRTSRRLSEGAARSGAELQSTFEDINAQGLTQLASAEGARRQREAEERAQKEADRMGTIGSVVGMGASLIALSSEQAKDKVEVAPKGVLGKLSNIRVDRWKYKAGDDRQDHIGPYAEEFNSTFNVGERHPHMISLVDAVGVTMAAIKELNQKVEQNGR